MLIELCAASIADCVLGQAVGVDRIELNSGLFLGGLTPSMGLVQEVLAQVTLPIIAMVRPRPGGFHYDQLEKQTMFADAKLLLEAGVAGLAFGFLSEDGRIDAEATSQMVQLCHDYDKEAVFHRAFDRCRDLDAAINELIRIGCDRILTSGGHATAILGQEKLGELVERFGDQIEICGGSGISSDNVLGLIQATGLKQVHGSFKSWGEDPTTGSPTISFAYSSEGDFEYADAKKVVALINQVKEG